MAGYIGTPGSLAVMANGTENKKTFNITTTTTALTGLSYLPARVHVYHNGIRLVDVTDFTATDGANITLGVAAENGDQIVVSSHASFFVADAYTIAAADGAFASAAQGTLAASALQPNGSGAALTGLPAGYTDSDVASYLASNPASANAIVTHAAAPAVGSEGAIYYNTTLDILFISNGSAWKEVVAKPPTTTGGTVSLSELTVGGSFTYALGTDFNDSVTSDANLTYVLHSGTLPSGVAISGVNLVWDGVSPTTGATLSFTIKATDEDGLTATQQYSQVQEATPANTVNGDASFSDGQSGTWTVPANVYSIAVVAIGGGGGGAYYNDGGGGGALGYKNNIAVTPGQTFTYAAAAATATASHGGAHSNSGGDSTFTGTGVTLVAGGGKAVGSTNNRAGGIPTGHDGGGNGGSGGYGGNHAFGPSYSGGGGGGAGGYSGNGGDGGAGTTSSTGSGTGGSGGGGGGGGGSRDAGSGGYVWGPNYGGNVGVNGQGVDGTGGAGSGDGNYASGNPSPVSGGIGSPGGGDFGGGGDSAAIGTHTIGGRAGAVRIVYKVGAFSFPSTNVG